MKRIVAFGDSVLRGVVIDKETTDNDNVKYTFLENNFTSLCGKRLGIDVLNYGKFGSTVDCGEKMMNRHREAVREADVTLLEYGGNDCDYVWSEIANSPDAEHFPKNDPKTFCSKYRRLIGDVSRLGSKPVLLSLPPLDPERYFRHFTRGMDKRQKSCILKWLGGTVETISSWHELYNLQLFKIGAAVAAPVIDITSTFLSRLDYRDYLCEDGIHPNEKGHGLIADAICEYVSDSHAVFMFDFFHHECAFH
ncbi:MAG: SGNH/GDSL hydrolase family protein [Candidatus Cryptobacteroides sp.]